MAAVVRVAVARVAAARVAAVRAVRRVDEGAAGLGVPMAALVETGAAAVATKAVAGRVVRAAASNKSS